MMNELSSTRRNTDGRRAGACASAFEDAIIAERGLFMEANNNMNVPYIVYEAMLEKEDRQQRRMVVIIILLIVLLVASNLVWVYEWNQYDYIETETETETESIELDADDGGNANYIGRDGSITNGSSEGDQNQDQDEDKE